jgi:integral membrane protein (TIGR01906 family)
MGFARVLATFVFILALPVAILTTNARLLLNAPPVYGYAFDRYDAERETGLSRADLDGTAAALREYFNDGEKTFFHPVTVDGLPGSVFNARETAHMEDVKSLVVKVNRAQEITSVYVIAYIVAFFIWARDGNLRQLAAQALLGIGLGIAVIAGVGAVALTGFDAAWDRAHELVFPNDLWQLDPATDRLIQMFPEPFWRDMTLFLGALCALEALLIGALSAAYLVGTRGARNRLSSSIEIGPSAPQAA